MKTQLDKAQSRQLIDLGFPKWRVQEEKPTDIDLKDWTPTITLTDLLEIFPKGIRLKFMKTYTAETIFKISEYRGKWTVGYYFYEPTVGAYSEEREELIDALYELCVWCLENKYIKC